MTSAQFVAWLEKKLTEHGVTKVVPDPDALASAYRRAMFLQAVDRATQELHRRIASTTIDVPEDLASRVTEILTEHPALSWDRAVWKLAEQP
ncbi:MAG: hypothetical protein JXA90_09845 [Planctomycetes bacterium]|nr:hypothetical protein [Planctomycetota bacterium]